MTLPFLAQGPGALVQGTAGRTDGPSDMRTGTVVSVTAYGAVVDVAGGQVPASYVDSNTPAVGDVVALMRYQDAWLIVGRPVGAATQSDATARGSAMGATALGSAASSGSATLASSTGAEVAVPGISLTLYHPPGHTVLLLCGYGWNSTAAADWIITRLRESQSATQVGEQVEPITSATFGRRGHLYTVAPSSYGGQRRTYYLTMQRLTGTGTTSVTKSDSQRAFLAALDIGLSATA